MNRQRIVVKVGTSVLTGGTPRLKPQQMLAIVEQMAALHQAGHDVVLVTSGAVAAGRDRLGFPALDSSLPVKQMLSAVGQSQLMQRYSALFDLFEIVVAQVLLTRDDLSHRTRFLNARDTLLTLIERRIVPVINENDTIATEEIRVGDNDNLSALVAALIEADALIMLTDQVGLFTADPRSSAEARLIERVTQIDADLFRLAGGPRTGLGTGGMVTKLQAAQLATRGGVTTWIASGHAPNVLARLLAGEAAGTRFEPQATRVESRKRWLLVDRAMGRLHIDAGAARVLLQGGASLLPVGLTRVEGEFKRGATVGIYAPDGREIAHGLASYDSAALNKLIGVRSAQIQQTLGYTYGDAVIHRNNMVLLT
jgi:glutamate 5-kinase